MKRLTRLTGKNRKPTFDPDHHFFSLHDAQHSLSKPVTECLDIPDVNPRDVIQRFLVVILRVVRKGVPFLPEAQGIAERFQDMVEADIPPVEQAQGFIPVFQRLSGQAQSGAYGIHALLKVLEPADIINKAVALRVMQKIVLRNHMAIFITPYRCPVRAHTRIPDLMAW